ncbi:hypothetical protein DPMN_185329 [Dreissena polymorpha]|uniref:Uncharacterized protein n=1 Tax=Dreissena polymorpha TaxID=45954 RepID=A0A9D4DL70_DREPO|nr:hypothetical protein DPMN_185329 [Dreissena polymorpha]
MKLNKIDDAICYVTEAHEKTMPALPAKQRQKISTSTKPVGLQKDALEGIRIFSESQMVTSLGE